MWLYIRQLIQLVLSPTRGWEDISESARTPDEIQRTGFYPWLALTALSELVRPFYEPELTFLAAFESAIAVAGAMFVSMYLARLFFDMTLTRHVDGTLNVGKVGVVTLYLIGVACLFRIVANVLPTSLTLVHFLPLLTLLIIFRSSDFVGVRSDSVMTYLGLGAIATIVLPLTAVGLLRIVIS